jgi:two-component system, OmpR family, sensor kinase
VTTLYTRILLSLWGAMIVIVLGAVGLTWLALLERSDDIARAPAHLASEATEALGAGGEHGLHEWLSHALAVHRDVHIFVIGPDGRELLGRPLPPRVAWLAGHRIEEQQARNEPPPPLAARLLPPRPVPVLVSANGTEYMLIALPHQGRFAPFEQPWARLAFLLLAVVVTGVASLWLTRSVSRPVAALGAATRELAAGNLSARVAAPVSSRRDELGGLARDFDAMAGRLQEQVDAKERLLQDISHELRSPLARMRVALGLARQSGASTDLQLNRIEQEAERLNALIGQLLTLSRLGSDGASISADSVDLVDLLDTIARDAAFEGQARGVRIEWQPPGTTVTVRGDAVLLASAIENVVRNALRYTPERSTVALAVALLGRERVAVTVEDEGPGVPEAELKQIFAPFHRVAESRGRDTGGDGLGLAITDRVMQAHHGTARAENRPGGGLRVTLEMPTGL